MKKVLHIGTNIIYTGVVLSVLALALLFVGTKVDILGYEVKIVKSGSMEPHIQTGGIVVIAPAETYRVGEVITYGRDTQNQIPVTHRIVERQGEGRSVTYITKGDANENADPKPVLTRDIIGKVELTLPYVGYLIEFARTKLGFALLIGVPALMIILDEFANITWEIHKYRFRRKRQGQVGYRVPSRDRRPRDFNRHQHTT